MVIIIGFGIGGLGGGGGGDYAVTTVGIDGGEQMMSWLDRFYGGWVRIGDAQDRANRSGRDWGNQSSRAASAADSEARSVNRLGEAYQRTSRLRDARGRFLPMGNNRPGLNGSTYDTFQRRNGGLFTSPMGGFSMGGGAFSLGMTGASGSAIALGMASIKASNDVGEADSLVAQVYGRNTQDIINWSQQRRKALGMNEFEQRRSAAGFQTQFLAGGMDEGKAKELSKAFVQMRDDLVSFYNARPEDAFAALQSGISGEQEPLKKYSIFASEAAVKQFALSKGIARANEEMSEQTKIVARAMFIMDAFEKGKARGDLQKTKDSPTNQWRRQQNELKMAQVEFGKALQPVQTDALKIANDLLPVVSKLVHQFSELDEGTRKWIIGLGLVAAPMGMAVGKAHDLVQMWKTLRDLKGNPLPNLPGGKGGLITNTTLMKVNAGAVYINGPLIGGGGLPGFPGGGVPRGPMPMPRGPLALPPGAATKALPGLAWQLRTLYGIGGAQAILRNAPALWQMNAPRALAAGRAALPTVGGLGLAARSLTPWGIGITTGLVGSEVIRHVQAGREDARIQKANEEDDKAVRSGRMTRPEARQRAAQRENERTTPDSFGEMAGNTGRRLIDVGKIGYSGVKSVFTGEEIRGWDSTRNQFQSDSEAQMADASKKYQADVKDAHRQADAWAMKYHRSVEERNVKFWEIMVERERHWATEYARNKSIGGYQEHMQRREQAKQNLNAATYKHLDASLERSKDQTRPGWREEEAQAREATHRATWRNEQYKVLKRAGLSEAQIAKEMDESPEGVRAREIKRQQDYLKRPQTMLDPVPGRRGQFKQVQRYLTPTEKEAELQKYIKQYDDEHGTGPKEKVKRPIWDARTLSVAPIFGMGPSKPLFQPGPGLADKFARNFGMEPLSSSGRNGAPAMGGDGSSGLLGSVNESSNSTRIVEGEASGVRGRDGTMTFEFKLPKVTIAPGPGDALARDIEHNNRTPWMPMP